ncbi:MAG: conserved phage C-terminal domain-containing protein [Clostridia bacterium]|nr:conserved phage C-terminal domain-containing protein [Clostridia bacterium]
MKKKTDKLEQRLKGKDPAVLFYTSDFLTGSTDLTIEERGQYITLLCLQHQKGHLSQKIIDLSVPNVSPDVLARFKKDRYGLYYNDRLEKEQKRREEYKENRLQNLRKKKAEKSQKEQLDNISLCNKENMGDHMSNHMGAHSENENENNILRLTNFIDNNINYIGESINIIVEFLNKKCKTHYKSTTKATISLITDKLAKGYTVDDFKAVITNMAEEWLETKFCKYLRPSTLFGDKFEEYLNKPVAETNSTFDTDELFQAALERSNKKARQRKENKTCPNGNS